MARFKCGNSKTGVSSETPSKYLIHRTAKLSQQTGDLNPQLGALHVFLAWASAPPDGLFHSVPLLGVSGLTTQAYLRVLITFSPQAINENSAV